MSKEAKARIKINKLLEEAGWNLLDNDKHKANVVLEGKTKLGASIIEDSGVNYEKAKNGFMDFLMLDQDGRPLVVLEAKREDIDPLSSKEQARNYARNVGARFIILSNGNIHYFWDTKHGNPDIISRFPTQASITQYEKYMPNPIELAETYVDENYVIETQMPGFDKDPSFLNETSHFDYLKNNNLKQLRPYQLQAIKTLQESAKKGDQRFLFEMATGTGKTLISAAVIKLFLKSGNARRVLFLVDRLELEDQAQKAFVQYLGKDFQSVIFKENRETWQGASVVVSTIQSFMAGDRYKKEFSPTDFELVISDEAHRSIGGNSRAVFEYFVGYKLGLTATPKNYLKGVDKESFDTQREFERRLLLDTYKTFGCKPGEPTYSYDLLSGVKDGFLINPIVVDARTEITTQLLSDEGLSIHRTMDDGETIEEIFTEKHFERKVFNEETNVAMCKAFIDNGLFDPIGENLGIPLFGKSIVFCVTQKHAARITNILNKLAFEKWPEQYGESDFAMQISSQVASAQQMTINFANNRLGGHVKNPEGYDTSKTRVAVTVGMMTTGYDCQDLLNIALMRPVFSPTDFVQIKGRGTRKFSYEYKDYDDGNDILIKKDKFKFFDFFATCEYFENDFPYDEKIKLPKVKAEEPHGPDGDPAENGLGGGPKTNEPIDLTTQDEITSLNETTVGLDGMRIDREGFKRAVAEDVIGNEILKNLWENGDTEEAEDFVKKHIFEKPKHFLNLDGIRKIFKIDRRITVKEFLQVAFGEKTTFEMKDELLESEWEKFVEINNVDQEHYQVAKNFFKAYVTDEDVRDIVKRNQPGDFFNCPSFDFEDYQKLNGFKAIIPQYIHDYAYHLTNL